MEIVYGPVQSLRYGSTVGVNLLGNEKVCSYNCVYCSLGPTLLTMNKVRKAYRFPTLEQLRENFRAYISRSVPMDNIVVSGNGEPTLYPDFDEAMKLVLELRQEHLPNAKVIVLSNGVHLDNKKVVNGLNMIDERVIKVDAGNDGLIEKINDPLVRFSMAKFLSGVRKLSDTVVQSLFFTGEIDNTQADMVDEWIEVIGMIKPKAIQLCTITRETPLMPGLKPLDEDTLYSIAFKLKKRTTLEATVFCPENR